MVGVKKESNLFGKSTGKTGKIEIQTKKKEGRYGVRTHFLVNKDKGIIIKGDRLTY